MHYLKVLNLTVHKNEKILYLPTDKYHILRKQIVFSVSGWYKPRSQQTFLASFLGMMKYICKNKQFESWACQIFFEVAARKEIVFLIPSILFKRNQSESQ